MKLSPGISRSVLALGMVSSLSACTSEVGNVPDYGDPTMNDTAATSSAGAGGSTSGTSASTATTGAGGTNTDTLPGGVGNPSVAPTTFECDESLVPEAPAWRRLTRVQYENTLRDLLAFATGSEAEADDVFVDLGSLMDSLPDDERPKVDEDLRGTYRRLDQGVAQSHVENWYDVAERVAVELTSDARLPTVVGDCAQGDSEVATCVADFVERFGARALRRPLDAEEVEFFTGFYGDMTSATPEGYADVIAGLLNAPQFLYVVEHGDTALEQDTVFQLSAFELASRLSYHFWDTMPDDALWEAALDGSLLDDDEYAAQVERMFDDARAQNTIRNFYREWLKLENLPRLDQANDVPVFRTFAGENLPSSTLHESMMQEVVDLVDYLTFDENGSLEDALTTDLLFPQTAELASLYGVEPSASPVVAPGGTRPGLFTRALFLSTGSANTRPIIKGVFLRENVLCDHIPNPPGNAAAQVPELSPEFSTRQVVEALTEQEGTACATCHSLLINPLGFVTENFDALGRERNEQTLFDEDGNEVGAVPVDTTTVPQVVDGDETSVDDAAGLMSKVIESGKADACLARQYFRYSFGRWEHVVNDGCALERMRSALVESGSIRGMLREVALTTSFKQRTIE